jgi:hypothetical protein
MFRIICTINEKTVDEIKVVNTGHKNKDGQHLYRIREPEGFNDLEIYHYRRGPWHVLAEKVLNALNKYGYDKTDKE